MKNDAMATNKTAESSPPQGEEVVAPSTPPPPPPPPPPEQFAENPGTRAGNTVFKSGPLFISSKGIGWTSWKKRWFILTRTSLVFFRSDPNALPQKGTEVNLILGGIDLYNSGSVVAKADKKLLTVLFPDGRAFTLKAETIDDLNEWKDALEKALAQAPSATLAMGQNGVLKSKNGEGADGSSEQLTDKQPAKTLVIGRPILLALEDVDGSPSFLEKALRFIEDHGIKVEGILRQAADVDEVEHRIRDYEQGKTEFSPKEDGHVIGDCVKYVLRELPSSPVPASCCKALLEACRTDRSNRVNAMRTAICETFPEPNRRLLQRILMMMRTVASQQVVNRMSTSAVAACMAPLLLRPLLSGECEIASTSFDVAGDGSMQLLQAAAAANHAQAIVITLLEQYETIFSEGTMSPGLYSDSEEDESEDEEVTDDDGSYEDDDESYEDDEQGDGSEEGSYTEDDLENESNTNCSESDGSYEDDQSEDKGSESRSSSSKSLEEHVTEVKPQSPSSPVKAILPPKDDSKISIYVPDQRSDRLETGTSEGDELLGDSSSDITREDKLTGSNPSACIRRSTTIVNGNRTTVWGRTPAKKKLSMESIDFVVDDEVVEIQKLEAFKLDLQNKISEEVKDNAVMLANLEQRKTALHERRLALEKDVSRLQDQLQEERDKRAALKACLRTSREPLPASVVINETASTLPLSTKIIFLEHLQRHFFSSTVLQLKKDLEEITQAEVDVAKLRRKVDELGNELNHQCREIKGLSRHGSSEKITRDRQKDNEDHSMLQFQGSSTDTDFPGNRVENADIKYPQPEYSKRKHGLQKHTPDASHGSNSKFTDTISTKSKTEERGSQHTNELQNLDKSKSQGRAGPCPSPRPGKGLDVRYSYESTGTRFPSTMEKGRGSVSPHSQEDAGKGPLQQNFEDVSEQKAHSQHHLAVLDRGKSEGRVSNKPDKGKGSNSKPRSTPRTMSR